MESKNIVISNEEEKIYYTNYIKMISEALLYYEKVNRSKKDLKNHSRAYKFFYSISES